MSRAIDIEDHTLWRRPGYAGGVKDEAPKYLLPKGSKKVATMTAPTERTKDEQGLYRAVIAVQEKVPYKQPYDYY